MTSNVSIFPPHPNASGLSADLCVDTRHEHVYYSLPVAPASVLYGPEKALRSHLALPFRVPCLSICWHGMSRPILHSFDASLRLEVRPRPEDVAKGDRSLIVHYNGKQIAYISGQSARAKNAIPLRTNNVRYADGSLPYQRCHEGVLSHRRCRHPAGHLRPQPIKNDQRQKSVRSEGWGEERDGAQAAD